MKRAAFVESMPDAAHFECDPKGFLFDPSVRSITATTAQGSDSEPLETLAALKLASKRVQDELRHWTEGHGLSESRLRLLVVLYHSPEHRRALGELAELLDVVPRTVTDLIDVLERDGWITRVPDPADRRSVHAQLTETGVARIKRLRHDAFRRQASIFSGFSAEELVQLRHLCLLLVQRLHSR
ncbi:MAG: MarR family transcriptional regulator [Gammaproteobacteria bacterium]|nr:MarR family transcriptional regulator [Gammaproteobacteria bacterium]